MITKIITYIIQLLGKIQWKQTSGLTVLDKDKLHKLLADNYYVILTHRRNHLTTYFISIANFLLTGKFSFWSHALMNLESDVHDKSDFRLIEAVGSGTKYSTFDEVFGTADAVVLLKPRGLTGQEWLIAMDKAKTYIGCPYDTLFDLKNDKALSCVELVRDALKTDSDYDKEFANFEKAIVSSSNLTPQMYYNCPDFTIEFEVRR